MPNSLPIAIHVATHRSSGSIPLTLGSFQQDGIELEIANHQHRRNRRHQKLTSVDSATSSSTNSSESQELSVPQPPPPSLLTSPASELIHLPGVVERTEFSAQLHDSRSQNVLVFLVAAQILLLAGYVCSLGARTHFVHILALQIARAVCSVLAIAGTMSAYLCEWFISSFVHRLLSPSYVPRACGLVLSPSLGASNASLADCRVAEPVNLLPSMAIMSLKVQFDLFCVAALLFFLFGIPS